MAAVLKNENETYRKIKACLQSIGLVVTAQVSESGTYLYASRPDTDGFRVEIWHPNFNANNEDEWTLIAGTGDDEGDYTFIHSGELPKKSPESKVASRVSAILYQEAERRAKETESKLPAMLQRSARFTAQSMITRINQVYKTHPRGDLDPDMFAIYLSTMSDRDLVDILAKECVKWMSRRDLAQSKSKRRRAITDARK